MALLFKTVSIGVTGTAVTVKLFPTGSSTACATLTLPFQGVGTAAVGPGNACKTAVDTITVAPIAATTIGTVYSAPANYTVDPNDYNIQIMVKQRDAAAPTYYGPVFSTSNGIVATPGTAVIVSQAHLKNFKQQFAAHNHRPLQLKPMKFHA